jgi:hypothetical protein
VHPDPQQRREDGQLNGEASRADDIEAPEPHVI